MKELLCEDGILVFDVHNCEYGGRRHKWTRFVTNVAELADVLNFTCTGGKFCDGSGLEHLSSLISA